jgi:hypothetical protein
MYQDKKGKILLFKEYAIQGGVTFEKYINNHYSDDNIPK